METNPLVYYYCLALIVLVVTNFTWLILGTHPNSYLHKLSTKHATFISLKSTFFVIIIVIFLFYSVSRPLFVLVLLVIFFNFWAFFCVRIALIATSVFGLLLPLLWHYPFHSFSTMPRIVATSSSKWARIVYLEPPEATPPILPFPKRITHRASLAWYNKREEGKGGGGGGKGKGVGGGEREGG